MLNGQTILITGGTGSFGTTFVERVVKDFSPKSIVIFSRDEKKQYDMRNAMHSPAIKFIIGDVRERERVYQAMKGVDYVFHAAALKQVPTCEIFPYEAVMTNVMGTQNVLDAAEECGIKKVIVLSTDKAVYPINAMGMSKALLEKIMLAKARTQSSSTVFCGVRYGNVMYSRGSVIPLFVEQIGKKKPVTITNPTMTRFLLPLPVAIELVLHALEHGMNGDILVRKSPAATMDTLADAVVDIFKSAYGKKIIGTREGEKLHETLITQEDLAKAEEHKLFYRIRNLAKLDYDKYFTEGRADQFPKEGYTSENTRRLNFKETKELILSLREIQEIIR
jgi:UDP-N-acetylglucosamine 4,6-dehydratase